MLIIQVTLDSAITGEHKELVKAVISNDGTGSKDKGNYSVHLYDKSGKHYRTGFLKEWPRKRKHVWALIAAGIQEALKGRR